MGKGGNSSTGHRSAPFTVVQEKKEILIDGNFYDTTGFKHPGGSIIGFLAGSGADATETYKEFHTRSKKADKFLKSLPSRPATASELHHALSLPTVSGKDADKKSASGSTAAAASLAKDYNEFRDSLEKEGFFEPNLPHVVWRLTEVVLMFGLAHWLIAQQSLVPLLAGIILHGVTQGRCGWLMHEGGHYSLTGVIKIDRTIQEVVYGVGCGMSGAWWRNQHNKHHATPQKLQHDVDLNTLPFVAFHKSVLPSGKKAPKPGSLQAIWVRNQAYLFAPVVCLLVGLGWTLVLHPRHAVRTKRHVELASFAFRYGGLFAMWAPLYGVAGAVGLYLVCFAVGTTYIFTNFAVSHTHLPVSNPEDYLHWVQYSSDHTTNIQPSWWCNWWMSYLNFQIEHHLFPSMPQFRHKIIAPRVKALFDKHGLKYDVRGYFSAMHDTFRNLDSVGQAMDELNPVH
mmetsp:Transcript_21082/g.25310  ORF Transcript_21082/g.25310 Transcript_21082/m.25310 type:complete len:454 (+) Transcript_21082:161-1522(+)|eukprot:CAMPEP_0197866346 /NCGR_PEP_ID=MMETSP1438-20131217/44166_1 /TAXON_ID=1461541 /ORGANISM="Pterosperma sp., Strain CCMP1384" /LENGTH=453 /DNA_ID=CAMNT_0043484907 /DNA_START=136 /DNA_END=1497 /DNA_ORIENTATION=+